MGSGPSISSLFVELGLRADNFNNGLKQAQKEAKEFEKTIKPSKQAALELGTAMAAAGAVVSSAMLAMVKSAADYGEELKNIHEKTGVAVENIAKWGFAAEQSESSIEGLSTGLRLLSKNMEGAINGGKEQIAAFDRLGISAQQLKASHGDLNKVFLLVADRFKQMPAGAEKSALAMQIFGKSGAELIPTLNLGSAGLADFGKQAEKLGIVMSADAAAAADEFGDTVKQLETATKGLSISVATALMPALTDLAGFLRDNVAAVAKFTKENESFAKAAAAAAAALTGAGGLLLALGALATIAPKVSAALIWLTGAANGAAAGMIALKAAMIAVPWVVVAGQLLYMLSLMVDITDANDSSTKANLKSEAGLKTNIAALHKLGIEYDGTGKAIQLQEQEVAKLTRAHYLSTGAMYDAAKAAQLLTLLQEAAAGQIKKHEEAEKAAAAAVKAAAEKLKELRIQFEEAARPADALNRKIEELQKVGASTKDVLGAYSKEIVKAALEQKLHGFAVTGATAALLQQAVALKDVEAAAQTLDAFFEKSGVSALDRATKSLQELLGKKADIDRRRNALTGEIPGVQQAPIPDTPRADLHSKTMDSLAAERQAVFALNDALAKMPWLSQSEAITIFGSELDAAAATADKMGVDVLSPATQRLIDFRNAQLRAAASTAEWDAATSKGVNGLAKMRDGMEGTIQAVNRMRAVGDSTQEVLAVLGSDLLTMAENARALGIALDAPTIQLIKQAKATEQAKAAAESLQRIWEQATANITSDFVKGFSDVIFHAKNFFQAMKDIAVKTAESMFQAFLTGLLTPLTSALSQLGRSLANVLTGSRGGNGGGILNSILGGGGGESGGGGGILGKALGIGAPAAWSAAASPGLAAAIGAGGPAALTGAAATAIPGGAAALAPGMAGAPVAGGGGMMGSMGALLTNPWTAVVAAGIIGVTAWIKSQAHHEANTWVKVQNKFDSGMSAAKNLNEKHSLVGAYLSTLKTFAGGGKDEHLVATQAKSTFLQWYGDPKKFGVVMPQFKEGTAYVPQTGTALVHEGERIVTASDNAQLIPLLQRQCDFLEQLCVLLAKGLQIDLPGTTRAIHSQIVKMARGGLLMKPVYGR